MGRDSGLKVRFVSRKSRPTAVNFAFLIAALIPFLNAMPFFSFTKFSSSKVSVEFRPDPTVTRDWVVSIENRPVTFTAILDSSVKMAG